MKKSHFFWSGLCLITVPLCSQDIESLLDQYRSDSDLSQQTKKESAGSVIVFTRDQLERMHAYNLRDILKTIPIFTMQEAVTGQVTLAKAKGSTFNSQFLKLYINDHEVGSIGFGSAMKMWGFLDISYIDHIEVYQVGSSVFAGDEPPGIVVRLYTKDPSRDEGGAVQALAGSRGSSEYSAYYAHRGEKYSTFVYANTHDENRKNYTATRPNSAVAEVDRDFKTTNLFASLSGDDFTLEAAQMTFDQDRLLGFGTSRTPGDNKADLIHRYLIGTQYFQDKTLKIRLAYDDANHIQTEEDPNGIKIYNPSGTTSTIQTWYYDKSEKIFDAVIDKQFILSDHDIHIGLQNKYKCVESNSLLTNGIERVNDISGADRWNTYSIFISDDWSLDQHNLLFTNLKYDHYDLNNGGNDFDDYVVRLGHVYNNGTWMIKTFGVRTYGYPVFMQSSYFPHIYKSDPNLKNESRMAASTEISYMTPSTTTNFRIIYNTAKNAITLKNNVHINSPSTPDFYALYASHEIRFDHHHQIFASLYYGDDDMPLTQSSKVGGLLQLFNTFGNFDLYNELLYRSGYSYQTSSGLNVDVKAGVDYTAGITYHASKDLSFFLKGENLFNNAIKTPYPTATYVDYISPFDRTVRVGLKYLF